MNLRARLAYSASQMGAVQHTVSDAAALDAVPFHLQGATSFYDDSAVDARLALRRHADVERVLDVWWQCARRLHVPGDAFSSGSCAGGDSGTSFGGPQPPRDPLKPEYPEKRLVKRATERAVMRAREAGKSIHRQRPLPRPSEQRAARLLQAAYRGLVCRRVTRAQYVALSMKLYYALVDEADSVDAQMVAEDEWARDARGLTTMGPLDFKDAIFECASMQLTCPTHTHAAAAAAAVPAFSPPAQLRPSRALIVLHVHRVQ